MRKEDNSRTKFGNWSFDPKQPKYSQLPTVGTGVGVVIVEHGRDVVLVVEDFRGGVVAVVVVRGFRDDVVRVVCSEDVVVVGGLGWVVVLRLVVGVR
jgi:hypothetical protein